MRSRIRILATLAVGAACSNGGWPAPPPLSLADHAVAYDRFFEARRTAMRDSAHSFVHWSGLWLLDSLPLFVGREGGRGGEAALPDLAPGFSGAIRRDPDTGRFWFEPASGALLRLHDGSTVTGPLLLAADTAGTGPTCLRSGPYHLWLHAEPGSLYFLRAADERLGDGFVPPPAFPLDTSWRVAAKLERESSPRSLTIPVVEGGDMTMEVAGTLRFRHNGAFLGLLALVDTDGRLKLMFRDATSAESTFGAGRYVWAPPPDSTGWTVIDFNQSVTPACGFTGFSYCPFPPRENVLTIPIAAGEQRPGLP